jgi:hypothetical protein
MKRLISGKINIPLVRFSLLFLISVALLIASIFRSIVENDLSLMSVFLSFSSAAILIISRKWTPKAFSIITLLFFAVLVTYLVYRSEFGWFLIGVVFPFLLTLTFLYFVNRNDDWYDPQKTMKRIREIGNFALFLLGIATLGGLAYTTYSIKKDYKDTKTKQEQELSIAISDAKEEKEEAAKQIAEMKRQQEKLTEKILQESHRMDFETVIAFKEEEEESRRVSMILALSGFYEKTKLNRKKIEVALVSFIRTNALPADCGRNSVWDTVATDIQAAISVLASRTDVGRSAPVPPKTTRIGGRTKRKSLRYQPWRSGEKRIQAQGSSSSLSSRPACGSGKSAP